MSMSVEPLHETLMKYGKECEKCKTMMTPLFIKVAPVKDQGRSANTIHYKCDKCGNECSLNVCDGSCLGSIDPKTGIILC